MKSRKTNVAKPSAWRAQQPQPLLVLRRGFNPPPIPRPLQGGGSTAPPRRSFIKVLLPKVGRREISYATKLRLFCVRFAHLNARNRPFMVLVAIVCAGFARVTPNNNQQPTKKASPNRDAFFMWVDFVLAKFNNCTTVELER